MTTALLSSLLPWFLSGHDTLSIGPGVFSLPEIATFLSTSQVKVKCDATLSDRFVYIYLKNRPRTVAQQVLQIGLDIELERQASGDYRLVSSSKSDRREKSYRDVLAHSVAQNFRRYLGPYASLEQPLPVSPLSSEIQLLYRDLQNALRDSDIDGAHRLRQAIRTHTARQDASSLESLVVMQVAGNLPEAAWTRLLDAPSNLHAKTWQIQQLDRSLANLLRPDSEEPSSIRAHLTFCRAPDSLLFDVAVSVLSKAKRAVFNGSGASLLSGHSTPSEPSTLVDDLFGGTKTFGDFPHPGFGRPALEWLANQRDRTTAFMRTVPALQSVNLSGSSPDSMSMLLDAWCQKTQREALMELSPAGEDLEQNIRGAALRSFSWSTHILPQTQWSFDMREDILVMKNLLAFVDRRQTTPANLAVQAFLAKPQRGEPLTLSDVKALVGRPGLARFGGSAKTYWGVKCGEFDESLDAARLLLQVPGEIKSKILALKPNGTSVTLPLTSLGLSTDDLAHYLFGDKNHVNTYLFERAGVEMTKQLRLQVRCWAKDPRYGLLLEASVSLPATLGPAWYQIGRKSSVWTGNSGW